MSKESKNLLEQIELLREAMVKAHNASCFKASKKLLSEALKELARIRNDQN